MSTRWDRTPMQLLEQQVRDLTAQLEQARKATDIATMRDMLSRAGIKFVEFRLDVREAVLDAYADLTADGRVECSAQWRRFRFDPKTGQLVSIT